MTVAAYWAISTPITACLAPRVCSRAVTVWSCCNISFIFENTIITDPRVSMVLDGSLPLLCIVEIRSPIVQQKSSLELDQFVVLRKAETSCNKWKFICTIIFALTNSVKEVVSVPIRLQKLIVDVISDPVRQCQIEIFSLKCRMKSENERTEPQRAR